MKADVSLDQQVDAAASWAIGLGAFGCVVVLAVPILRLFAPSAALEFGTLDLAANFVFSVATLALGLQVRKRSAGRRHLLLALVVLFWLRLLLALIGSVIVGPQNLRIAILAVALYHLHRGLKASGMLETPLRNDSSGARLPATEVAPTSTPPSLPGPAGSGRSSKRRILRLVTLFRRPSFASVFAFAGAAAAIWLAGTTWQAWRLEDRQRKLSLEQALDEQRYQQLVAVFNENWLEPDGFLDQAGILFRVNHRASEMYSSTSSLSKKRLLDVLLVPIANNSTLAVSRFKYRVTVYGYESRKEEEEGENKSLLFSGVLDLDCPIPPGEARTCQAPLRARNVLVPMNWSWEGELVGAVPSRESLRGLTEEELVLLIKREAANRWEEIFNFRSTTE